MMSSVNLSVFLNFSILAHRLPVLLPLYSVFSLFQEAPHLLQSIRSVYTRIMDGNPADAFNNLNREIVALNSIFQAPRGSGNTFASGAIDAAEGVETSIQGVIDSLQRRDSMVLPQTNTSDMDFNQRFARSMAQVDHATAQVLRAYQGHVAELRRSAENSLQLTLNN